MRRPRWLGWSRLITKELKLRDLLVSSGSTSPEKLSRVTTTSSAQDRESNGQESTDPRRKMQADNEDEDDEDDEDEEDEEYEEDDEDDDEDEEDEDMQTCNRPRCTSARWTWQGYG